MAAKYSTLACDWEGQDQSAAADVEMHSVDRLQWNAHQCTCTQTAFSSRRGKVCYIWTRHHIWMSHYIWMSHHVWRSHVPPTNESCPSTNYSLVHMHIDSSFLFFSIKSSQPGVLHMKRSSHTDESPNMNESSRVNESCPAYAWVMGLEYYGVATISRLLKIIGLFCRISSLL